MGVRVASLFSSFAQAEGTPTNAGFQKQAKGKLLWRIVTFFLQENINNFPAGKRVCFADKDPLLSHFRNPAFACVDSLPDERRKPLSIFSKALQRGGVSG